MCIVINEWMFFLFKVLLFKWYFIKNNFLYYSISCISWPSFKDKLLLFGLYPCFLLPFRGIKLSVQFSCWVMFDSATLWTAAHQASLSITNTCSPPIPMCIESVMPSNHLNPLSPPSPPALNLSQHQGLFKWLNSSHQVAKLLEFQLQHQSFQWTPRTNFL